MSDQQRVEFELPPIPDTRYFGIGDVSKLCKTEPHVLRYWEGQFEALNPMRRSGNRRYYTRQDIHLILKIKFLLKDKGYTIGGARDYLKQEAKSPPQIGESIKRRIQQAISNLNQVRDSLSND